MLRLAVLLALLIVPAAAAQEAPDERVAARTLAESVDRFAAESETVAERIIVSEDVCRRETRRVPEAKGDAALLLLTRYYLRKTAKVLRDDTKRLRTEIGNVQTRDAVLLSGRAAWRQYARALASTPDPEPLCAELRAWRRAGYPMPGARRAAREVARFVLAVASDEFARKTSAAIERMIELGVPPKLARRFSGA